MPPEGGGFDAPTKAERKAERRAARAARSPRGFGRWRNWRLPVKFAAVVLVPVVFAVSLGVVQIYDQVQQAQRYDELTRLTQARNRIQPLLTGLQVERTRAAQLLGGSAPSVRAYRATAKKVTVAVKKAPEVLEVVEEFSPLTSAQFVDLRKQLARLPKVRKQVLTSSITPVQAVNAYNDMINSLLSLERAVINTLGDARLYGSVNALFELSRAEDEIRSQRALVVAGLSQNDFTPPLMDAVNDSRARLQSRFTGFRAAASPAQERDFEQLTAGSAMEERRRALDALAQTVATTEPDRASLTLQQWNRLSKQVIAATSEVRTGLSRDFEQQAFELADDSSKRAITVTALLAVALVIATVVIVVISRNLLGSLRVLRRSALDAANHRLPQAVSARIRHGESGAELEPVPVRTTEEVGQVARAFDDVNRQALYLASEQATLRRGYSDSFVNISRRSQSLLERQLRLFEQLEQDEDDPDQLATLFRLDHLATRMRRNNENLMVLSGSDMARRFNQPVELSDVLRAAVSEIEHYPRVVVQSPPATRLVGYAASDLVRLMAELLDNAANFSAPSTSVTVSSYQSDDASISIDVLDRGIGMDDAELADANDRLASFDEYDLSTSRRMGLLVIARLAGRHGITVRLHGGEDYDGVRAHVAIPGDLVAPQQQTGPATTQQLPKPSVAPPVAGPGVAGPQNASAIEQQMSPGGATSGDGRRNGVHQEAPTARTNGSARRQVLEGGLPGQGGDAPAGDRGDARAPGEQPDQVRPESGSPRGADEANEVELESPDRLRGLFEPAAHSERPEAPEVEQEPGDRGMPSVSTSAVGHGVGADEPTAQAPVPTGSRGIDGGPGTDSRAPGGTAAPRPEGEEPIFAEMAPQWFQPAPENANDRRGPGSASDEHPWPAEETAREQADETSGSWAFDAATTHQSGPAPRPEPTGYTASGLPRRSPRPDGGEEETRRSPVPSTGGSSQPEPARATATGQWPDVPGNGIRPAANTAASEPVAARQQRDAEALRGRLSSFQQGTKQNPPAAAPAGGDPEPSPAWNFSTDQAQQEAEAAANPHPSDFTSAGLPRRTPRAHLAPGSAGPPKGASSQDGPKRPPQPDETRGRLSSFQQGIRRGRHSAGD